MTVLKKIPIEMLPLSFPFWKRSESIDSMTKQKAGFHVDLCGRALCMPQKFYKPIRPSFFLTVDHHGKKE